MTYAYPRIGTWHGFSGVSRQEVHLMEIRRSILEELIREGKSNRSRVQTVQFTADTSRKSVKQLTEDLPCTDMVGYLWMPYTSVGNMSVKTCHEIEPYCADLPAYPRAYCPQTCGCE